MKHPFLLLLYSLLFSFSSYTQAQIITTVAGNGTEGHTGDSGPATAAELGYPAAVAIDGAGNMYIADYISNYVRKVNTSGVISTIAGTGTAAYTGDGGAATLASLSAPSDIAIDGAGNIFIVDLEHNCIRKINTTGIITTVAGTGTSGYSGDGAAATLAKLHFPSGVAVDGTGNIYIADRQNNCIRKVDTSGIITTIAGTGTPGFGGDGGAATSALLNDPGYIVVDRANNIYITDGVNYRIRKVNAAGIITTISGDGTPGFYGDGGPATAAELSGLQGITLDGSGKIYFVDHDARIRTINAAGIITTIAGSGVLGYSGDSCAATAAEFNHLVGVAVDGSGHLYIADYVNQRIRMLSPGHPPYFTHGHAQSLSFCGSAGAVSVDSLLAITDSDIGQTETWSVVTPPVHGSVAGLYTTTSTGGMITPAGLSYTPASGYAGADTFIMQVTDCGGVTDTTTLYVTVNAFPNAGTIAGPDTLCTTMASIILTDTVTGGIWSRSNASATVAGGVVSEITTGRDTIFYVLTNSCGIDTAMHVVSIVNCPAGVNTFPRLPEAAVEVHPNPNNGTFTVTVVSAKDEPADVVITNMVGENVKRVTTTSNEPVSITLNVPAGVYFLTATTAHYQWNTKIVVQ